MGNSTNIIMAMLIKKKKRCAPCSSLTECSGTCQGEGEKGPGCCGAAPLSQQPWGQGQAGVTPDLPLLYQFSRAALRHAALEQHPAYQGRTLGDQPALDSEAILQARCCGQLKCHSWLQHHGHGICVTGWLTPLLWRALLQSGSDMEFDGVFLAAEVSVFNAGYGWMSHKSLACYITKCNVICSFFLLSKE